MLPYPKINLGTDLSKTMDRVSQMFLGHFLDRARTVEKFPLKKIIPPAKFPTETLKVVNFFLFWTILYSMRIFFHR